MTEEVYVPNLDIVTCSYVKSVSEFVAENKRSLSKPDAFWSEQAARLYWKKDFATPVCRYNFDLQHGPIFIEWFSKGKTNMCYNCLDRHIQNGKGSRVAYLTEANDEGPGSSVTYQQLKDLVCQIANYMKSINVQKGDDITIYMPMVPELPAVMLACARIGAIHSVVFGGFSAEALADRILDSKPNLVITAAFVKRGAKVLDFKSIVDEAVAICSARGQEVPAVLVFDRDGDRARIPMTPNRNSWWSSSILTQSTECPVEWMDSEDPLFKLYTSGSTGKPKAVLHTTGGYMVGAYTSVRYVFEPRPEDVFWCMADCGWITGHTFVAYGPLLHGMTQVIFEGIPTWPDASRNWKIVDKYLVSIFYTSPTAIRAVQAQGNKFLEGSSRESLRLLACAGEPMNPEAWKWFYHMVGKSRCPIMDTWWQTETGSVMLTPLPSTPLKPGSVALPFFGVEPAVVDEQGREMHGACEGRLIIKRPWPSMMRTIAGDHKRFEDTYFSTIPGAYFTGDGVRRDADGYYWIVGRVDDVINVSGHRIGTAEIESALASHAAVAEAAVVPIDHPIKGQAIYAFVVLAAGQPVPPPASLSSELKSAVTKGVGAIAVPEVLHWAPGGLPKTRSGKTMRRVLRKIASGQDSDLGDLSTIADASVIPSLIAMRGKMSASRL